jgi:hypothetical protein
VVRERGSKYSGQVEAMPRIIRRKKEERKETKGIIKVAFLLPDDACVRKVDLKGRKEKETKSEWCTKKNARRPLSLARFLSYYYVQYPIISREQNERKKGKENTIIDCFSRRRQT